MAAANSGKKTGDRTTGFPKEFFPTDEELVADYLKKKVTNITDDDTPMIQQVEFYNHHPQTLFEQYYPEEARRATLHAFAYFYSRPYRGDSGPERDIGDGYWLLYPKGLDNVVKGPDDKPTGAVRRTMFFYKRTNEDTGEDEDKIEDEVADELTKWAVQEYRMVDENNGAAIGDWVLCRLWDLDHHFQLRRTGLSQPYEGRITSL